MGQGERRLAGRGAYVEGGKKGEGGRGWGARRGTHCVFTGPNPSSSVAFPSFLPCSEIETKHRADERLFNGVRGWGIIEGREGVRGG